MATQPDLPGFSYNLAPAPAAPRYITPPAPQVPYVNPGGSITLGEFAGGGARQYPLYDPRGAANVSAALPYQAAYTPGQYGGVRAALPPASEMPLAIRPNMAPAPASSMSMTTSPATAPAMKPAQVLNVRTIPGTGGAAADAIPMLEAGGAKAAGVGSKLATVGSVGAKALPLVGDVLQGYANSEGSWGRGISAGLGSLAGRLVGGAAGTATAPVTGPVGPIVGEISGSFAGAAGAAKLYDMATGADSSYINPAAVRQAEENAAMRAVPSRVDMPQGLTANTGGTGDAMRIDAPAPGSTTPQITRQQPGEPTKYEMPSAAVSKPESTGFQEPTAEEKARYRRETGSDYTPLSVNAKLSIERMRAGEETFDTKQANAYRKANPNYRPGQYVKGYNPNAARPTRTAAPVTAAAPAASRTAQAPAANRAPSASAFPSLEQRGLARTVSSYDPMTGIVTRNTSPRPTPEQTGAAARNAYYANYRNSRR